MEILNDIIGGLLDASPPFLLGFALWFLGLILKKVPFVQDWSIPFILAAAGGIVYPFVAEQGKVSYQVSVPWMLNVLLGVGIAGGAVLADQMRKQWLEFRAAKKADEDTTFLRRDHKTDGPK